MQVTEVMTLLQQQHSDAKARLDIVNRETEQLEEKVAKLEEQMTLLVELAGEMGVDLNVGPVPEVHQADGVDWRRMTRTQAVTTVLRDYAKPMSPAEIRNVLQSFGRDDGYDIVGSTLAYL